MEQLIQEVLRILNQPGTREDLENSIQGAIQSYKNDPTNTDTSQNKSAQNIALLKERLAEQKLLARKSETKANNLVNMNKQKTEALFDDYKKQMDEEKNSLVRSIQQHERINEGNEKKLNSMSEKLVKLPDLEEELTAIQELLSSEKEVQENLLAEKRRAEDELKKISAELSRQSGGEPDPLLKESIKKIKDYKDENSKLKEQVTLLKDKFKLDSEKETLSDTSGLEEQVDKFQNEINELQEKLNASEREKEELNKHKEEIIDLQKESDGEAQKTANELNALDEQNKNFEIINKLNEESFNVYKTVLNSTQSFDERINKLDIFIKKTKEHIEKITSDNQDVNNLESYSTDILDYFSTQIDKKEALKKILIAQKQSTPEVGEEGESNVIIFKKVNKKHAHHGGSWKVAYADFVTAMMAFFLMLWLLSMLSQESRDNLKEYFKSYKAFKHTGKQDTKSADSVKQADSSSLNDVRMVEEIKKRFQGADEHLKVENVPGGIRIQVMDLMNKPMFKAGSASFTPAASSIMEFIALRIKDLPGNVIIEGHTDGTQYAGSKKSNWELSMERASAARIALVSNGMLSPRIRRIIAYGGTEPLNKGDYFNPSNRRISIIIITDDIADVYKKALATKNSEKSNQH